ncbi:helix-turn-helix domain-containing protein [Dactylosporangium sp. NPDC050688]|uniref:MarR family transcriptional regulator n=1 Tax=Dactylosporangium sp. NPDC050688 TaxID=3157217 RepID=UPI0033FE961A
MTLGVRYTTRDLRRRNRAMLLSLIYHQGAASRVELMQASGLSSGSVSNVAGDLVEAGMVAEVGLAGSDGGRPRTLLQVRPGYGDVVGVVIAETNIRWGRSTGSCAARPPQPSPSRSGTCGLSRPCTRYRRASRR